MAIFTLNWSPAGGGNSLTQTAKYRANGSPTWITTGFSPANPLGPAVSSTSISGLLNNTIYEFQVETNCTFGGPTPTSVIEQIVYACIGGFSYDDNEDGTADLTITGLHLLPDLNFVQFRVYDETGVTLLATSPNTAIANPTTWTTGSLGAGDYILRVQYGAILNGVQQFSSFGSTTCDFEFTITNGV